MKKQKLFLFLLLFLANLTAYAQLCGFAPGEGCSNTNYDNSFLKTLTYNNPATIEYDNFVSTFHASIVRTSSGGFKVWGEGMANDGVSNVLSPQDLNATNYPALGSAKVYKVTGASNGTQNTAQFVALTSDGLYAWGVPGSVINGTIKSTKPFGKIAVNGKADGLPPNVSPGDVKMMTAGASRTLVIVTCSGDVWVLALDGPARGIGDNGSSSDTGSSSVWSRVQVTSTTFLTGIVAARVNGSGNAIIALKSDGTLWTWGYSYLGNGTGIAFRTRATQMTAPAGTPKMIGIISDYGLADNLSAYYVLMTNGNLYAMGMGGKSLMGDWTGTGSTSWIQPRYTSTSGPVMNNIAWISPGNSDIRAAAINVLTTAGSLYAWGSNDKGMIGAGAANATSNPTMPAGIASTDKIIAVQTGGHTTMLVKECSTNFGYVGHRINGSMGNGSAVDTQEDSYTFSTAPLEICSATPVDLTSPTPTACGVATMQLSGSPAGGTYAVTSGPATVSNTGLLTFTGDGNVTVQYTSPSSCGGGTLTKSITIPVTQNVVNANAGSNQFLLGANQTILAGNNPSPSTGMWTLLTKPAAATDPVIVSPSAYNTQVTGLTAGAYTFRWTVTTGNCTSASDLAVNVIAATAGGVPGVDFWVKSDDAGAIATAWKDNSLNADHIPNVGGMTLSPADRAHNFYPYTTGYTSARLFYNANSAMNSTNAELPNTNTSIFSAVRPTANGAGRITGIDDDATYAAEPGISITAGKPRHYEYTNVTTTSDFATTFNIGQSNIFSAIADNTIANGGTSSIAGGEKRLGLNGSYQSFSGFGANKFQIYGRNLRVGHAAWDVNGAFPGDIMEVIWYKRTLTANEQSRVNSYLAVKNGVTSAENYLASTSSVVWDMLINTGYTNNIFGIARDNASALHQKQSGSVNVGQKLVISTTGFADNNAANSTGIANDLQFLMTGDNGLYQGLKTPFSYTAGSNGVTNYRFEAIWKVQNSGNVGTVTVAWPKGVKNLYLVQSQDAVFDATDTFTPMATEVTVNGVVYNTANVTLSNGQFFTFAGFGNAPGGVANGLSYWYRADKNAANTGAATDVTGWTDVWNGTTVAQLGANALPKYVPGVSNYFNFNPGINFTAVTQTLGNINVQTVSALAFDIFTLTKENILGNGANNRLFSSLVDNNLPSGTIERWDGIGLMTDEGYPNYIERVNNAYGSRYLANPGNISRSTTIPSIMYHRFTDLAVSKGLNGAANGGNGAYAARGLMNGGHAFGDTRFLSNGSDNGGFTGHIGETIIYGAGNLTTTERRKVDSYLAIKYGITLGQVNTQHYLDADGNMVWNGGTNTTYNNNVFGVAREDIGLFEQKVSNSVNTGTILTVATGNDFVNPNNTVSRTSFANDKTYFLLGDNNNVTTTLSSIAVNGFTGGLRIPRVWLAQRTNTSGAMYFAADLSAYGAGFGSGYPVKMIIADNAAFTSNVVSVPGTYDATTGKWVHSYNFDSGNTNRYITYAALDDVACTTGCNNNTYLNATDPNTIEYDNMVASEINTIVKQKDGSFYIWGPYASPNVDNANSNLILDLLTPTKIDPATLLPGQGSGFNYIGTPLKATTSGGSINAHILLTTDGLYTWGSSLLPYGLRTPVGFKFGKQSVNGKADGLPPGVSPANVKMMVANQISLTITTCSGAVWNYNSGGYYGDGATRSSANDVIWHRVMRSATQSLDNVVAVRGIIHTKFALTSDGKLYTWGYNTFHNDNTAAITSDYATEISVPAGVTPKMIGMTEGVNTGESSYYLLATNGKLYAMGYNGERQLGDGTATLRRNWVEITAIDTDANGVVHSLSGNIAWISPAEHNSNYPSISVLTTDGKQWGWGYNLRQQLGGAINTTGINPRYMPGNGTGANELSLNDKVVAVEDGNNHVINFKASAASFGFIGANVRGSMGDGSNVASTNMNKYTYVSPIDLCGLLAPVCTQPGVFDTAGLPSATGISDLAGFTGGSTGWPANVPNGHVVIESKNKGFVITRVSSSAAIVNPVEGMLIYDIAAGCVKLYNGTVWNCLAKDCL